MVVLLAVLATIAVPSMRDLVATARVRAAATELQATLVRARSEAINRNASVDVVPAGGWGDGWQLRVGALSLAQHPKLDGVQTTPAAPAAITFRLDGRIASGQQVIVLSVANAPSVRARCVVLDARGRAAIHIDADHDPTNGCN